ncbi:MAG: Asp23/Gls24 family envelope stress response protein [Lachnospiraceae bacterium]|nr:Asp23/Gls24 family envelope stress response protein [Lachnospiraceae bacterium]MBQ9607120.1 Asp23/Gls24 family envelope stress response protein [Lachnospiraceae bacterium]MBR1523615.1 Asp23/Gls24 family envelope stress response protein [Lachnospiraceae bacterium]
MAAKRELPADKKTKIHTLDSTKSGEVKIADDVVASIAAIAAGEIDGVSAITGNISDMLKNSVGIKGGAGSGVRVDVAGNMVRVDIAIVIKYGNNVMETSKKVQDKVKNSIENMTGLNVTDVNIRITGVNSEIRTDK